MIALLMSYQVPYSIILYILTMIKSIAPSSIEYYYCISIYHRLWNIYSLIRLPKQIISTLYGEKENYRYITSLNIDMGKKD